MPSKTVVVVDDDQSALRTLECWLVEAGYDVVSSARFEEARAYLASHTPDILLADVRLGEFNGLQLALFVKAGTRRSAPSCSTITTIRCLPSKPPAAAPGSCANPRPARD